MQNSEKNHIEYFLCSFKQGMHIICGAVAAIVLRNTLKIVLYTFQISFGLLRINILPQVHFFDKPAYKFTVYFPDRLAELPDPFSQMFRRMEHCILKDHLLLRARLKVAFSDHKEVPDCVQRTLSGQIPGIPFYVILQIGEDPLNAEKKELVSGISFLSIFHAACRSAPC